MIGAIARKELTELRRDGRYRLAAGLVLALLLASSLVGWRNYLDLLAQAREAAAHDYGRWGQQQAKSPHDAAHHGVYVFKTPRPLSILDGGIEPYVGAAVLNGAHLQSEAQYPPAQEMTALQRFGELSPALVGQALLPLLVILLSFGAFAGEREQGTLRQLLSQGVAPSSLFWGKALGIAAALSIALAPAVLIGLVIAGGLAQPQLRADELARAGVMASVYGLYLAVVLFLSLGVSARCRTSRGALIILLTFWGAAVFAAPRVLLDAGGRLYPAPSSVDYWARVNDDWNKEAEARLEEVKNRALAEHHVDKVEDLPYDFTGEMMQSDDEAAQIATDRALAERFGVYERQNRFLEQGAFLAPVVGVSLLSMALSGNDLAQQRDFIRQAEEHRRDMGRRLNRYWIEHSRKDAEGWESWRFQGDAALWRSIPPFVYEPRPWTSAVADYPKALAALALWAVGSLLFARRGVSKLTEI